MTAGLARARGDRRDRAAHARHLHHAQGDAALDVAALQPARSRRVRPRARRSFHLDRHRGPRPAVLRGGDQPDRATPRTASGVDRCGMAVRASAAIPAMLPPVFTARRRDAGRWLRRRRIRRSQTMLRPQVRPQRRDRFHNAGSRRASRSTPARCRRAARSLRACLTGGAQASAARARVRSPC